MVFKVVKKKKLPQKIKKKKEKERKIVLSSKLYKLVVKYNVRW